MPCLVPAGRSADALSTDRRRVCSCPPLLGAEKCVVVLPCVVLTTRVAGSGVVTDNWNMDKGALNIRPKGDDPALPGVKTHGW
eukprot:558508-Rhodomonas_salina.2